MNTKQRVAHFQRIMDEIQRLAGKAEQIGWEEIREHKKENMTAQEAGWAMQTIASHINWWFANSSDYYEEWRILEKEGE